MANIVELVSNPAKMVRFHGHTEYYMEHEHWDTVEDIIEIKKLTRPEKHKLQYPKIATSQDARKVKLADRLANVLSGDFVQMYRSEYEFFRNTLHVYEIDEWYNEVELNMWQWLDELMGWGLTNEAA